MSVRRTLTAVAAVTVPSIAALALAAPAQAMHDSPAPVGEMAPSWSGHYTKPEIGQHGAARPWEAGPSWNR